MNKTNNTGPGYPDRDPLQDASRVSIRTFLLSVLKRPWIPILIVLLFSVPAAFYFLNQPRLFRSQSEVMVPVKAPSFSPQDYYGSSQQAKPLQYYTSILRSMNYKQEVLEELQEDFPLADINDVLEQLNFRSSGENGLFSLYSLTTNEDLAQPLVEAAVSAFRERITGLDQQEAGAVLEFINAQLDDINQKTVEAEEKLQNFLRENKFVLEDPDMGVAQELTKLENQLAEAETRLRLINLDIESTEQQIATILEGDDPNQLTTRERRRQILERERREIQQKLSEAEALGARPSVLDSLTAQQRFIETELLRLITTSGNEGDSEQAVSLQNLQAILEELSVEQKNAVNRVKFFEAKLQSFREQHPDISRDILEYTQLQRQRDVLTQTLAILLEKKEEARIRMASQLGKLKVVEDPTVAQPQPRNTIRKMLIVLFMSLLVGLVIAYIVDIYRNTVDAEPDITQNFRFPLLGVIPRIAADEVKKHEKHGKQTLIDPESAHLLRDFSASSWLTESMRSIRTALLFQAREKDSKVFLLTSPMSAEGKTLTAANLAIMVQHSGRKTLLIDADLRRPKQHRRFGLERSPGLTDYLLNEDMQPEAIIRQTHEQGLFMITAGGQVRDPAELVASRRMQDLLERLKERFDFIFVDSPPVLPAVDSRLIGEFADGIILVARAEQTRMRSFQSAVDMLESLNVRILGAILNHADRKYNRMYYFAYGRYHAYYHYYYRPYTYYGTTYTDEISEESEEVTRIPGERRRGDRS